MLFFLSVFFTILFYIILLSAFFTFCDCSQLLNFVLLSVSIAHILLILLSQPTMNLSYTSPTSTRCRLQWYQLTKSKSSEWALFCLLYYQIIKTSIQVIEERKFQVSNDTLCFFISHVFTFIICKFIHS